jgi:hypothetical protein
LTIISNKDHHISNLIAKYIAIPLSETTITKPHYFLEREIDLVMAPCTNGILKVGATAFDLCNEESGVTRLWYDIPRKKVMAELTRNDDVSMRIPALTIKMVDNDLKAVRDVSVIFRLGFISV